MKARNKLHTTSVPGTSANVRKNANRQGEQTAKTLRAGRNKLRLDTAAIVTARRVFPVKTAYWLSEITGYPERTCDYWLQTGRLPADALCALIRSAHGFQFIVAIMGKERPTWFTSLLRHLRVVIASRLQALTQRMLKDAIDADRDIAEEIARAEAILADSGAHLDRSDFASLVPLLGAPDRALASARG